MYRYLSLCLICCSLLLSWSSCCTKADCATIAPMVSFKNFPAGSADSCLIEIFSSGSGFSQREDSFRTYNDRSGAFIFINSFPGLKPGKDYRITLPAAGRVYHITKTSFSKRGCNKCFPFRPSSDYYEQLNGFELDGKYQSGSMVEISY